MFINRVGSFASSVGRVAMGAAILGLMAGSNALANPTSQRAPQGRVGPNGGVTYTCIAQVSFIAVYPETIDGDGGFTPVPASSGGSLLGSENVSGATIEEAASKCHAYTRSVYRANTAWSNAAQVCSREEPANDSMTILVYATDYFQQIGNANGVNRDDGLATICDPTAVYTIQYTL
jgi:hypothetical protein